MGYLSLMDEVGRLRCHVSLSAVNSWRSELHVNTLTPQKARVLHLELGEYALALDMHPALAGATSYSYDTRNELLNETSARNGGYSSAFGYDGAENPTTFKGSPNSFNADNQNAAFAFDGNGNPTTYKGVALGFDPENRLTSYDRHDSRVRRGRAAGVEKHRGGEDLFRVRWRFARAGDGFERERDGV